MTKQRINQIVGSMEQSSTIPTFISSSLLPNLGHLWMDKRT